MGFFSSARLAGSLLRRSLQSNQSSINHVFQSGICTSSRGLVNSSYEKVLGSNAIIGGQFWHPSRAFHGTRLVSVKDYYDVLGVSKTASQSEIKETFDMTERKFQEARRAYETLKDEQKRSLYDQVGPDQYEEEAASGEASPEGQLEGGSGGNPSMEMSGGGPVRRRGWDDVVKEFCVSFVFTFLFMSVILSSPLVVIVVPFFIGLFLALVLSGMY